MNTSIIGPYMTLPRVYAMIWPGARAARRVRLFAGLASSGAEATAGPEGGAHVRHHQSRAFFQASPTFVKAVVDFLTV